MKEPAWPPMQWPEQLERITPPSRTERYVMRVLILCGLTLLAAFAVWLMMPSHRGDPILDYLLLIGLAIAMLNLLLEWRYYWYIKAPKPQQPNRTYTVDILTTACPGEPKGMILRTLEAMQKITYPHTSYLCDEGDDPELKAECERLGVVHVTRTEKKHAKAGNINNALRTKCTGEITIILDPDHEPAPYFIDRVLGYFNDPKTGFVQTIQAYRNQNASIIASEAAQMQYHFYGPIEMGMHGVGTPQAIGANCAFRREALDSIDGHASGLAEDMHTTMRLYAHGWKGIYVPEVLTRGLVPQTLGAFYKQQLKWSCGTFDLLFQEYPSLFKGMTWSQRLHFLVCPAFFLQGWITLICMLVPVLCLLSGGIAWKIGAGSFALMVLPLVAVVVVIRAMAQRFVLSSTERGLHLRSSILTAGSWWVFCVGNLCALFRHKVPYVPTPKDDEPEDAWKIAVPNFIAAGICLAAVPYGLLRDFSPYNMIMAAFALWNALALLMVTVQGQQKAIQKTAAFFKRAPRFYNATGIAYDRCWQSLHSIKNFVLWTSRTAPATACGVILAATIAIGYLAKRTEGESFAMPWMHLVKETKERGGFYSGLYLPRDLNELGQLPEAIETQAKKLVHGFDIASLYLAWGPQCLEQFPENALRAIIDKGGMPMITWEPWTETFPWVHEQNLPLAENKGIFKAIAAGNFDYFIADFAVKLRDLEVPVFLRFGHEMDNPQYPWSPTGGDSPQDFKDAWRRVVQIMHLNGASNVAYVYNPWRGEAVDRYYPGDDYVDWIGLTLLNYGQAGRDGLWHAFDPLYQEFDHYLSHYDKPVMLAEFGSTSYGGDPAAWISDAMQTIHTRYPQIQSVVLFHSDRDKNWASDWRPDEGAEGIDWTVLDHSEGVAALNEGFARFEKTDTRKAVNFEYPTGAAARATQLKGASGNYSLEIDGHPFYIKGVAYNPGHDWRDGDTMLSRRKIEYDFDLIKAMGANTIRRYSGGWADYNLFNIAAEKDLKILYGLWLKQDIDYLNDAEAVAEYEEAFMQTVERYRDEQALLGWVIGNEVWGMFKHSYAEPYLTDVRIAYVQMVERLARRIKVIDPDRPVFVSLEHSAELAGAISDYTRYAPSVDAIGINSYYDEHYAIIPQLIRDCGNNKPYLVSEFGPVGYWNEKTPLTADGLLDEPTAQEKAAMCLQRWNRYILSEKGNNLGGVAYCWSERYEGSATWFGLVDRDGKTKPAYEALKQAYTEVAAEKPTVTIQALKVDHNEVPSGGKVILNLDLATGDNSSYQIDYSLLDNRYRPLDTKIETSGSQITLTLPKRPGTYWFTLTILEGDRLLDEKSISFKALPNSERPEAILTTNNN